MRKAYPIILRPMEDGWFMVTVPDFDVNTQGKDMADAMFMARDVIGLCGIDMQDDGKALPEASAMKAVEHLKQDGDVITLVDVDFDAYRRQNDLRTVKKNCTVPAWLSNEAERRGINFSALLQSALKSELKAQNPEDLVRRAV